jgi:hypothetical protein
MKRMVRLSSSVVLSLAVSLVVAPGARADKVVHRDARHDVVAFDTYKEGEGRVRPGTRDPDIVRAVVRHREHAVTIRLRFRELRYDLRFLDGRILTPTRRYDLDGYVLPIDGVETVWLSRDCPRLTFKYGYVRDLIRIRVPRRCLGRPAWVRVSMVMDRAHRATSHPVELLDDAFRRGIEDQFSAGVLTGRLYRA